jgi:hypothetical protein
MTPELLISEGRRLARPSFLFRSQGSGPPAAIWHERNDAEAKTGFRWWISVDARFIPGFENQSGGYVALLTDERDCEGGRVELKARPDRPGVPLYATEELILPPIEAVFARGSESVGHWLVDNNWSRDERYNDNFRDRNIVRGYERIWFNEYPLYRDDGIYAMTGGWHFPGADDDWYELMDEQLMILTFQDSEPWVEAWRLGNGQFRVIQRVT